MIIGRHLGAQSPVQAPAGINYLLVTLHDGEAWQYLPPAGHIVAWAAVIQGMLLAESPVATGEIAADAPAQTGLSFVPKALTRFVLGSAIPHAYPLVLGNHSVHSSAAALQRGEARIAELRRAMQARAAQTN